MKNIFCLQVGDDGNICTSLIQFTPGKEDDQKFLSCQGRNELIEESGVEDQWKITVYCKYGLCDIDFVILSMLGTLKFSKYLSSKK